MNRKLSTVNKTKPICGYQYAYTADGLLSSRTKSVWRKGGWQQFGRHDYTLAENTYTVEFSRWNRKKSDYDLPVGRMTYTLLPDESIGHEGNRHFDIST